jgi:hypothetical protein
VAVAAGVGSLSRVSRRHELKVATDLTPLYSFLPNFHSALLVSLLLASASALRRITERAVPVCVRRNHFPTCECVHQLCRS